ncbi:MAG: AAA family ATPase [Parvibaculaceae bacterium]
MIPAGSSTHICAAGSAGTRFFVISGGPGSGKSTLINALREAGHACIPEAGRAVIREEMASGGSALPWADRTAFAERMLEKDLRSYRDALEINGLVFFDRGIPDTVGYLALSGLPLPDHMDRAVREFRYGRIVFIAPPWRKIFHQDAERKQDFEEAVRTHEAMAETYARYGYELVPLPLAPVAERLAFTLGKVAQVEASTAALQQ